MFNYLIHSICFINLLWFQFQSISFCLVSRHSLSYFTRNDRIVVPKRRDYEIYLIKYQNRTKNFWKIKLIFNYRYNLFQAFTIFKSFLYNIWLNNAICLFCNYIFNFLVCWGHWLMSTPIPANRWVSNKFSLDK